MSYTYGDQNHKHAVTALSNGNTYSYDANGNMTNRHVNEGGNWKNYTLAYDAENHLTSVSGDATASFGYNGDGQRITSTEGSVTTAYIGNYFEWNESAGTLKKYYYAGATRIAMRSGSGDAQFLLSDDTVFAGAGLGSTIRILNYDGSSGALERGYKPWGEMRFGPDDYPTGYQFTGQYRDKLIGLYYYGARWYDANLSRWVQPDSLIPETTQGVQAWDRFAYSNNSPVNFIDSTGHWSLYFNLSELINSMINSIGINSTDAVNCLNTVSTILDGIGLAIDTAVAAGDIISGTTGALAGGFVSIPEAGAPSVVTVPVGAAVSIGLFEVNPATIGAKLLGNGLATLSTITTTASDVISAETNVVKSIDESGISYSSSIGRDTFTSGVTCITGWLSPLGLSSAPLAAIPFANDLEILYTGPLSDIAESIPIIDINIQWE